jgi:predicted SnoaL-like aldol condensation-catalyzing enzyme
MNNEDEIQTRKRVATEFLQLVTVGRIQEAYDNFVDMNGKHHNVFFRAGFPALQRAMMDNDIQFPGKHFSVKNVIAEGHLIAVHSHLVLNQREKGMVVVHLFRFEGDKIVEMWDCGQSIPADSPNQDGAF